MNVIAFTTRWQQPRASLTPRTLLPIFALLFLYLLAGCSHNRYHVKHDYAPSRVPNAEELNDATPTYETPSKKGNYPYTVNGIRYIPHKRIDTFEEQGEASWYGSKFHGHLTANGEVYDMYQMTAAHKTLPIPSYLRVTNLNNQKQVIVRVNDRGPFYQQRILDLSYAAAYKIGVVDTGVAPVHITLLSKSEIDALSNTPKIPSTSLKSPMTETASTEATEKPAHPVAKNNDTQSTVQESTAQESTDKHSAQKSADKHSAQESISQQQAPITTQASTQAISTASEVTEAKTTETNVTKTPKTTQCHLLPPTLKQGFVVQVLAASSEQQFNRIVQALDTTAPCHYSMANNAYRLLLGPFDTSEMAKNALVHAQQAGYTQAFIRRVI